MSVQKRNDRPHHEVKLHNSLTVLLTEGGKLVRTDDIPGVAPLKMSIPT